MAIKYLNINITSKKATYLTRQGDIVCGNSDYRVRFNFDSEWEGHDAKVARFIWGGHFVDVEFTGDEVDAPVISGATQVKVGVYTTEDGPYTTTSAVIPCTPSILCEGGTVWTPPDTPGGGGGGESVKVVQETGDSTTAVMSQKASTESFMPKPENTSSEEKVPLIQQGGNVVTRSVSSAALNYRVVIRDDYANAKFGIPQHEQHAVPFGYANEHYAPKLTPGAGSGNMLYQANTDGTTSLVVQGAGAYNWSVVTRDGNACSQFGTPTQPKHAATKEFVEAVYRHDITFTGELDYSGTFGCVTASVYTRSSTPWGYDGYNCTLQGRHAASGYINIDGQRYWVVGLSKGTDSVSYFIHYADRDTAEVLTFAFYDGGGYFTDTVTQMN